MVRCVCVHVHVHMHALLLLMRFDFSVNISMFPKDYCPFLEHTIRHSAYPTLQGLVKIPFL